MNLRDFYLDDFDFFASGFEFCNADFSGASLVSANFTSQVLTGATFAGAKLREAHFRNATLSNADFSKADMAWELAGSGHRPLVVFKGAEITGATFDEACLSGVDFRGIGAGLKIEQMTKAYAAGARFNPTDQKAMETAGALQGGPGCQKPR